MTEVPKEILERFAAGWETCQIGTEDGSHMMWRRKGIPWDGKLVTLSIEIEHPFFNGPKEKP